MGVRLVLAIGEQWPNLGHAAARALVFMAAHAADDDTEPRYWAGLPGIARYMGQDPDTAAGLAVARRAVQELRKAGALTLAERPHPGRNAVYRLCISQERGALTAHLRVVNGARLDAVMVRAQRDNGARSPRTRREVRELRDRAGRDSTVLGHQPPTLDALRAAESQACAHGAAPGRCAACRLASNG